MAKVWQKYDRKVTMNMAKIDKKVGKGVGENDTRKKR